MEYANKIRKSVLLIIAVMFSSATMLAQAAATTAPAVQAKPSVYTSPIFYALALVAILLLLFIVQLGGVLTTVAKNYTRGDKSIWDKMKMIVVLVGLSLLSTTDAIAAAPATPVAPGTPVAPEASPVLDFLHQGFGFNAMNALAVIILVELFVIFYLVRMIRLFTMKEKALAPLVEKEAKTSVFWDKFNASVAVETEAAVMTDHEYDGIRELDNALPPWWKYGFYFTIVWSVVYLAYYHISNGPSSTQEYKSQMDEGARQIADYRARAKNLVDETNVVLLTDAGDIDAGKAVFTQYCVVCHGPDGGGVVGPNLTDKFWIHGGDIKDMFKTIKYGVQGKGMKSWQQELSPVMMAQVASYIRTLQGTTPVAPKSPEGAEWVETAVAPAAVDTTGGAATPADTAKVVTP